MMTDGISESLTGNLTVPFPEYLDPPADPVELFRLWVKRAVQLGVREPRAMAFSTVDAAGQPSSRILVISEISTQGLIFTTHTQSRKAREFSVNPKAAALLYWRETSEQIAICGHIKKLSASIADQMWAVRPIATHPMTIASRQSASLVDVEQLREKARHLARSAPHSRPDNYAAYELVIDEIEFWANGTERLHERLLYKKSGADWEISRLQP